MRSEDFYFWISLLHWFWDMLRTWISCLVIGRFFHLSNLTPMSTSKLKKANKIFISLHLRCFNTLLRYIHANVQSQKRYQYFCVKFKIRKFGRVTLADDFEGFVVLQYVTNILKIRRIRTLFLLAIDLIPLDRHWLGVWNSNVNHCRSQAVIKYVRFLLEGTKDSNIKR